MDTLCCFSSSEENKRKGMDKYYFKFSSSALSTWSFAFATQAPSRHPPKPTNQLPSFRLLQLKSTTEKRRTAFNSAKPSLPKDGEGCWLYGVFPFCDANQTILFFCSSSFATESEEMGENRKENLIPPGILGAFCKQAEWGWEEGRSVTWNENPKAIGRRCKCCSSYLNILNSCYAFLTRSFKTPAHYSPFPHHFFILFTGLVVNSYHRFLCSPKHWEYETRLVVVFRPKRTIKWQREMHQNPTKPRVPALLCVVVVTAVVFLVRLSDFSGSNETDKIVYPVCRF